MAKNIKTETPKTEEPKKAEQKWKAGKYKVLKTYIGTLGAFTGGSVYELTEEQAEAFGKAGEIEVWLS